MYAAHLRRYHGEPVGGTAELENDRVSLRNDDLAVDRATSFLRTRPPVGEEGEEVSGTHTAVAVERSKKPPAGEGRGCGVVAGVGCGRPTSSPPRRRWWSTYLVAESHPAAPLAGTPYPRGHKC